MVTQTSQLQEIASLKRVRRMLTVVATLQMNFAPTENVHRAALFSRMAQQYHEVHTLYNPNLQTMCLTPDLAGKFRRVHVKTDAIMASQPSDQFPCPACNNQYGYHDIGHCPLKLAGVEYCNLCGLAHFAEGLLCPHLNSTIQLRILLDTIKKSPETQKMVLWVRKLLTKIKADLLEQDRKLAEAGHPHPTVEEMDEYWKRREMTQKYKRMKLSHSDGDGTRPQGQQARGFEPPKFIGTGNMGPFTTWEYSGDTRAIEMLFEGLGGGVDANGNPPLYPYPPGVNVPQHPNPQAAAVYPHAAAMDPQATAVDPHAAAFAAVSQAPRQFSTFNSAPPPAGA